MADRNGVDMDAAIVNPARRRTVRLRDPNFFALATLNYHKNLTFTQTACHETSMARAKRSVYSMFLVSLFVAMGYERIEFVAKLRNGKEGWNKVPIPLPDCCLFGPLLPKNGIFSLSNPHL